VYTGFTGWVVFLGLIANERLPAHEPALLRLLDLESSA
jgi:hypothetical protein